MKGRTIYAAYNPKTMNIYYIGYTAKYSQVASDARKRHHNFDDIEFVILEDGLTRLHAKDRKKYWVTYWENRSLSTEGVIENGVYREAGQSNSNNHSYNPPPPPPNFDTD